MSRHARIRIYFHNFKTKVKAKFRLHWKSAKILPISVTDSKTKSPVLKKSQITTLPEVNVSIFDLPRKCAKIFSIPITDCKKEIPTFGKKQITEVPPAATVYRQEIHSTKKRNTISASFRLIITVAVIIGLPIPPSIVYPKKTAAFLRTWSTVVFGMRVVFILFVCVYNHLLWPSYAMRYSYLVHCLLGFALMLIFYAKGQDLALSLQELEQISVDREKDKTSSVDVLMSLCFVCFTPLMVLGAYYFFFYYWHFYTHQIAMVSLIASDSFLINPYSRLVLSAVWLSYNFSSATFYVTTLLFCWACLTSGRLLHRVQVRMKRDSEGGPLTAATASRNIRSFRRIFLCIQRLDCALNQSVFGVYAAVINGFYIVLSIALSGEELYRSPEIVSIASLIGLVSTIKLLSLSLFGDFLHQKHRELQRNLIEVSNGVVVRSSVNGVHLFSLLCANIRTMDVRMTGFGFFNIDRKIIPSVVGIVITYGVAIYQTGAMHHL